MAKHHHFWQQDYKSHIGATIQIVTCFLAFVFVTVGTPLGQLMFRTLGPDGKRACHTLWGVHDNCWNAAYSWRADWDTCTPRRTRFQAAEAFSILAIFSLLLQLLFACYQVSGSKFRLIILGLALLSIGSTVVPWAVVAATYNTPFCGDDAMTKKYMTYGAGFALLIVSFIIQCIGLALFIFLEP